MSYTYDDVTDIIQVVHLVNNSQFPVFAELHDSNLAMLWSGEIVPQWQAANPPATFAPGDYNVVIKMIRKTAFGRPQVVPAFGVYCRWPA